MPATPVLKPEILSTSLGLLPVPFINPDEKSLKVSYMEFGFDIEQDEQALQMLAFLSFHSPNLIEECAINEDFEAEFLQE